MRDEASSEYIRLNFVYDCKGTFRGSSARARSETHRSDVSRPVVVRSEESEDDEYDLEEVAQDRGPHVAQKVENLPLEGRNLREYEQKY